MADEGDREADNWLRVGGRSSVVEFQPSKLAVVGSNPIARSKLIVFNRERCMKCARGLWVVCWQAVV